VDEFWDSLTRQDELLAAQLLRPECTSVIRVKVFDTKISPTLGQVLMEDLDAIPFTTVTDGRQFLMAFSLATRMRRKKAYDTQYLAVAQMEGAEIVTVDRGLRQAAIEQKIPVRFLR
jgi:predicted nucleic acid-binding protein